MAITASMVKELREATGAGMMDCKKALEECRRRHGPGRRHPAHQGPRGPRQEGRSRHQRGSRGGMGLEVREDRGDGRGQLRDRLRRAQRRVPVVRLARSPSRSRSTLRTASRRARPRSCPSSGSAIRPSRSSRRSASSSRSSARTWAYRASCATRSPARVLSAPTFTGSAASAWSSTSRAARSRTRRSPRSPRTWPCTSPPRSRSASCERRSLPRSSSTRCAIYKAQAAQSGKPEAIQEKIAAGRLEKYYKEVCLVEQPFVKDPDKSVAQLVAETAKATGKDLRLVRFDRFVLGETVAESPDPAAC